MNLLNSRLSNLVSRRPVCPNCQRLAADDLEVRQFLREPEAATLLLNAKKCEFCRYSGHLIDFLER